MPKTWTRQLDPASKAVLALVHVVGPTGRGEDARFVLDIGTPVTIINRKMAELLGMGEDRSEGPSRLWGPTSPDDGYRVRPAAIHLMGSQIEHMQIRCHKLSPGAGVDGLVGLDIIRKGELVLNLPWGLVKFTWN